MVEPVRHRQTKEAGTDMFEPKATAPHPDSTDLNLTGGSHKGRSRDCGFRDASKRFAIAAFRAGGLCDSRPKVRLGLANSTAPMGKRAPAIAV